MPALKIVATHVSMDVENLKQTMEYLERIGMEKLRELYRPDIGTIAWYPGLELRQADATSKTGLVKHVAWQVDDISEAIDCLKQNGVTFETEEPRQIDPRHLNTKEAIRYIFFSSPAGFQGELYEVKPPAGPD